MFRTRVDVLGSHLVLAATGDLDLASVPVLRSAVQRGIDDGATALIVDLSECELVDSAGLGVLLGALRRARSAGGELQLVVPERLDRVFTACDLDRVFTLHRSAADIITMDPAEPST